MTGRDLSYRHGESTMVYDDKPGPSTHTFLLIHGIGMGRIVFDEVGEILSSYGRVISVDLPGFGSSPEPGSAASLEETAEFVAGFIRSLNLDPVTLVGHSMGTQIVAEIALNHPDLVNTLVLIAPTVNKHERTATRQALRMVQDLTGTSPKVLLIGLWEYAKTNPLWFMRKLRFMLHHHIEDICPNIETPTLVMRGEKDKVCPRDWVTEIAEAFPRSEMDEIPGHGHEAVIKNPEPAASMIRDFALRAG